jgi:hypothetical protein
MEDERHPMMLLCCWEELDMVVGDVLLLVTVEARGADSDEAISAIVTVAD